MSNKLKKFKNAKSADSRKVKTLVRILRYAGYLALILIAAFTINEISFLIKITSGITVEKQVPSNQADVEIIYSKGNIRNAKIVSDNLTGFQSGDLLVTVVGMEALDGNRIHKSLVISRSKNTAIAEMIAERMGIANSEVIYRAPIKRDMSPAVTLVLGEDLSIGKIEESTSKEI